MAAGASCATGGAVAAGAAGGAAVSGVSGSGVSAAAESEVLVFRASPHGGMFGAHVTTVVLNRPRRGNALSPGMTTAVVTALREAGEDDECVAVVLTGKGRFFCTGMDLGKVSEGKAPSGSGAATLFDAVARCAKPVVCRLNGPALGGGTGLVFASDIRVMPEDTYLQFPEVKRGIVPAFISAYIAPQLGLFQTKQYMMLGTPIRAKELHRLGAVSSLAAPLTQGTGDLDGITIRYCDQLRTSAPRAVATTKQLVRRVCLDETSHQARVDAAADTFAEMIVSDEVAFGVGHFMRRETPDWQKLARERKAAAAAAAAPAQEQQTPRAKL